MKPDNSQRFSAKFSKPLGKPLGTSEIRPKLSSQALRKKVQDENLLPQERPSKRISNYSFLVKPRFLDLKDKTSRNPGLIASTIDLKPKITPNSSSGQKPKKKIARSGKASIDLGNGAGTVLGPDRQRLEVSNFSASKWKKADQDIDQCLVAEEIYDKTQMDGSYSIQFAERRLNIPHITSDKKALKNPLVFLQKASEVLETCGSDFIPNSPENLSKINRVLIDSPPKPNPSFQNMANSKSAVDLTSLATQSSKENCPINPFNSKRKFLKPPEAFQKKSPLPSTFNKLLHTFDKKKGELLQHTIKAFEAAKSVSILNFSSKENIR